MTPRTLTTLRNDVFALLKCPHDDITTADINNAIKRALRLLNRRSPRQVFEENTGDGATFEWALSTSTWQATFSVVKSVVYPFEVTTQTPTVELDPEEYWIYEKTAGAWWFVLKTRKPVTGEKVRITYTTPHTITAVTSGCTIPTEEDEDRVVHYAAALCFRILAAKAVQVGSSNFGADTVSYQSRASQYESLAKTYEDMSGLKRYADEEESGAMYYQDLDTEDIGGEDWLTHPRLFR